MKKSVVCSLHFIFSLRFAARSLTGHLSIYLSNDLSELNFIFKSVDLGPLEVILPKHLQLMRIYPYFNLHHLKLQQSNC